MPLEHFYQALVAYSAGDLAQAAAWAHKAVELAPDTTVFVQAAAYLDRVLEHGKSGVYIDGEAFGAFIRGGGNVDLYTAASEALHNIYGEYETLSLLDIGVGDGLALLPALTENITRLDLIEPSEAMLGRTTAQLTDWQVPHHAFQGTIQDFIRTETGTWDMIQATWSLQSVPPAERPAIFAWARAHGERLLVAEFDVPNFPNVTDPHRVQHIVGRYAEGLAEYEGDQVAQGFLMPVMFGYFDQSAARTNWEGPIQEWADALHTAGFDHVTRQKLYDYWWAPAYLLDAR
jgi:hypothetical protein